MFLCTAPEMVGRQRYGRPVDCWAIGVIMYILYVLLNIISSLFLYFYNKRMKDLLKYKTHSHMLLHLTSTVCLGTLHSMMTLKKRTPTIETRTFS